MPESQFFVDEERPHLGGYIKGGDFATYYPDLWAWLVEDQGVSSVIDVGCGEGHACGYFASLGLGLDDVIGIDGVDQGDAWGHNARFIAHDYTKGKLGLSSMGYEVDLCWSCEFVEHIEEQYIPNFLETFGCARHILMTHAEPGQQGHHHVNCQPRDYWVGVMAAIGYELDWDLSLLCRAKAMRNEHEHNHFARSGLAFAIRGST